VLVIVMPPVSASVASIRGGPGGQSDMLTASSPLASPGDAVVLQIRSGARWRNVQARRLDGARQATFMVRALGAAGREYRMVLLVTAAHGLSLSNTITIPPR
jgi:hypothetical protein